MRDVNLPWIGQRGSRELANLRQIEFGGTYTPLSLMRER